MRARQGAVADLPLLTIPLLPLTSHHSEVPWSLTSEGSALLLSGPGGPQRQTLLPLLTHAPPPTSITQGGLGAYLPGQCCC